MKKLFQIICFYLLSFFPVAGQLWSPDLGDGKFKNPIIFADYSDPDVVRVGKDYYMVSSSFNCMPGIPILHSTDLVHWEIINHVYQKLPLEKYNKPVHGQGCWAPSIRYHNGKFYVYFCTPYDGLFMATTNDPENEWELSHVVKVEYWEDPCPIWDEDGNAYLVRSKLCGDNLYLHKMSPDGKKLLDNGTLIYRDKDNDPIIEGPKFMKKDDYYYILAPAGGVGTGWQTVLRSKNIYGPYERKTVLQQGNTAINGPHQGGLVDTELGEWYFVHFQEKKPTGRIVHLNPVKWVDGWPVMGVDIDEDGIGEPVLEYKKPKVKGMQKIKIPYTTDGFNSPKLGLQWQWQANPQKEWYSLSKNSGSIRLNAVQNLSQEGSLWLVPNLLLQKFPAPVFSATTKIQFSPELTGEQSGLVVMGRKWAYVALVKDENTTKVAMFTGENQKCEKRTEKIESVPVGSETVYLRVKVDAEQLCRFEYSLDNKIFMEIGKEFRAKEGVWIGAKVGIFCMNPNMAESKGYADFDWFSVE
jgi:beta-xylosidase